MEYLPTVLLSMSLLMLKKKGLVEQFTIYTRNGHQLLQKHTPYKNLQPDHDQNTAAQNLRLPGQPSSKGLTNAAARHTDYKSNDGNDQ